MPTLKRKSPVLRELLLLAGSLDYSVAAAVGAPDANGTNARSGARVANVEIVPPGAVTTVGAATAWDHPYHAPGASY